jgi:hypothetical protein
VLAGPFCILFVDCLLFTFVFFFSFVFFCFLFFFFFLFFFSFFFCPEEGLRAWEREKEEMSSPVPESPFITDDIYYHTVRIPHFMRSGSNLCLNAAKREEEEEEEEEEGEGNIRLVYRVLGAALLLQVLSFIVPL